MHLNLKMNVNAKSSVFGGRRAVLEDGGQGVMNSSSL